MTRFANLLQAPNVSIYQLVKTITFVLYLFDMVEMNKNENEIREGIGLVANGGMIFCSLVATASLKTVP